MLSIVIPHYNSINTLRKLLDSIPVRDDIEIIVVDDKSNKNITEFNQLVESEKYNHVKFLKNNTNKKGAGVCRNIGLRYVTKEWILFADADDFFMDGFVDKIKDYVDTDFDIVYFTPTSIDLITNEKSDRHVVFEKMINDYLQKKDRKSELKLRYEFPVPWSKLIKVQLIKENDIQFDEVIASNDIMFSAKIGYHAKKITASENVIYCVTKNKGSLTNTISEEVFDTRLQVRINYCKYLKNKLNKDDQQHINLSGRAMLLYSITFKLGIKKVISTYMILKKNNIEIFNKKYVNPFLLIRKIMQLYTSYNKNKKFYVK